MNENQKWIVFLLLVAIALYSVNKLFKGVKAVGEVAGTVTDNFGLTESEKAKALNNIVAFNPSYYKGLKGAVLLKKAGAVIIAEKIYDARTLKIYTDDDAILGAFKQLKNWAQISFVADVFYEKYDTDLKNYFWLYMQDRIKRQLFDYINSLPKK